ncbi:MAG: hypothetical protein WCA35_31185, partial [Kovacikia sp.]
MPRESLHHNQQPEKRSRKNNKGYLARSAVWRLLESKEDINVRDSQPKSPKISTYSSFLNTPLSEESDPAISQISVPQTPRLGNANLSTIQKMDLDKLAYENKKKPDKKPRKPKGQKKAQPVPIGQVQDPDLVKNAEAQKRQQQRDTERAYELTQDTVTKGDTFGITLGNPGETLVGVSGVTMKKSGNYQYVFYSKGKRAGLDSGTLYTVYTLSDHRTPTHIQLKIWSTDLVHMHCVNEVKSTHWTVTQEEHEKIMKAGYVPPALTKMAGDVDNE